MRASSLNADLIPSWKMFQQRKKNLTQLNKPMKAKAKCNQS